MMFPAAFDEENNVLGPPKGMSEQKVASLSVWQGEDCTGQRLVVSCWKITPSELAEIQRTGRVWLTIYGATMPPVFVCGFSPFGPIPPEACIQ